MNKLNSSQKIALTFLIIMGIAILYMVAKINGWGEGSLSDDKNGVSLMAVFLTGLLTGGLTCLAVQGGLLAATIAQQQEHDLTNKSLKKGHALPILGFLGAKIIAYTILGGLLGWFGSLFELSLTTRVVMQFVVIVFMVGTALNLLNVHPIFRYFVIQPPRFLTRMVRRESKSKNLFAPVILGAFTVFIPCGTTQAMMALAIGSGSVVLGALILAAFTIGTSPVFFTLGYFTTRLSTSKNTLFMRIAAVSILLLAVYNLQGALALSGTNISLGGIFNKSSSTLAADNSPTVTNATIEFTKVSYSPNIINVRAGSKVTLNLVNKSGYGCIQAFTIPSLNYQKVIPVGSRDTVTFTVPREKGQMTFMCSMGMYQGIINII